MSTYLKRFIFASLAYLGLAAIFGILNGITDIGYIGHFGHTHFNLLGFMSMMIYGIGYFIIPRFNGVDLRFAGWVPVHFWLGNISLIGMVLFRGLAVESGSDIFEVLFIIAASVQVVTIFMFIINIWITLTPAVAPVSAPSPAPVAPTPATHPPVQPVKTAPGVIEVTAEMPIAKLVDARPDMVQFLATCGLPMFRQPGHLEKVRSIGVTFGMAASNHGLDLERLLTTIRTELEKAPSSSETAPAGVISADTLIGKVIEDYPQSRDVFQKYFGGGCSNCPGQAYESIDMACRMHGVDMSTFLAELRDAIGR
ncbi:MAG: DUF1858 domain-containing protein [candidate division Zixibacteria bacterium]|nr:DUF1858 domain-containing protein [candidate division Zixibacteria bacterium]